MARTSKDQSLTTKTISVRPPATVPGALGTPAKKRSRMRPSAVPAPTPATLEVSVRARKRVRTAATVIHAEPAPAREVTAPASTTKSARLIALLQSEAGASMTDTVAAFGWLPHSARAALTGLRKRGHAIVRSSVDGTTRYRIAVGEAA